MAEWLQTAAGQQYVLGIAGTLGALVVFFLVMLVMRKRKGNGPLRQTDDGKRRNRVSVIEITELDEQRSFVLVRRDNVEHLVLVGGNNDLVIEGGIERSGASRHNTHAAPLPGLAAFAPEATAQPAASPPLRPAPVSYAQPDMQHDPAPALRVEPAPPPALVYARAPTEPSYAERQNFSPVEPRIETEGAPYRPARPAETSLDIVPVPMEREQDTGARPSPPQRKHEPDDQRQAVDLEMQRFLDDLAKGRD